MDRISDSGSDGCGSIPHGGTKRGLGPFLCTLSTPSHFVTAPVGHTSRSLYSGRVPSLVRCSANNSLTRTARR